jgi:hypothetical protein
VKTLCAIGIIAGLASVAEAQSAAEHSALDQCLAAAPGSASDGVARVFYLTKASTSRDVAEFINATRTTAEVMQVSQCAGVNGFAVRGTTEQIAVTDWLINQVYGSGGTTNNSRPEFVMANTPLAVVHVYHMQRVAGQQGLQELTNLLRTITEAQRVAQINNEKTVVVRGEAELVAMADWLVNELDRSPQVFARQYVVEDKYQPVARILPLPQVQTAQAAQELINLIRTMTQMQRVAYFTGGEMKAIVARGPADSVALADWLVTQIQNPSAAAAAKTSRAVGSGGESVRLFYPPASADPQKLASVAKAIVIEVQLKSVSVYSPAAVIAVRGTTDQLAKAEKVAGVEP